MQIARKKYPPIIVIGILLANLLGFLLIWMSSLSIAPLEVAIVFTVGMGLTGLSTLVLLVHIVREIIIVAKQIEDK